MQKQKIVQDLVLEKISSITSCEEEEDVYCLATENNGNFIANGIVVKNCDALRYVVKSFMKNRSTLLDSENAQNASLVGKTDSRIGIDTGFGWQRY